MVDFDAAVAAVQDPNADPVFLAKIAYENPEFGANVVANPRPLIFQQSLLQVCDILVLIILPFPVLHWSDMDARKVPIRT